MRRFFARDACIPILTGTLGREGSHMDVRLTRFILTCVLSLFATNAFAVDLTTADRMAMLYSPQLQFSVAGDPMIKIGLIEGQDEISFTPSTAMRVLPLGDGGPEIELPGGVEYRVSLDEGHRGEYRYWAVVARFLPREREQLARFREVWTTLGYATETFRLGSLFSVGGQTFDNRETLLCVGGLSDREAAEALVQLLERDHGVPAELHADLVGFPTGQLTLRSPSVDVRVTHRDLLWVTGDEGSVFEVNGASFATNPEPGDGTARRFTGSMVFTLDRQGRLALVNELPAERLLEGILPVEIYASAPMEALKAQAVAARGELLADLGVRYLADPYMTCADQRCQVYRGVGTEHRRTSQAVEETRGVVILDERHIAHAVYSASCGGSLGDFASTWGGEEVPYLRSHMDMASPPAAFAEGLNEANIEAFINARPDTYDNIETFSGGRLFRWEVTRTRDELSTSADERYGIGAVLDLEILERDASGRVIRLEIEGAEATVVVERELPIRRALGGLRSALFIMEVERDSSGSVASVRFNGAGFGHGVGLCQIGSIGAAERGLDYVEILSHYYPGTRIEQIWD